MANISAISFAVRTASNASAHPIKLSHAQQLVVAALGYKSLAAFQASPLEAPTLDDAAHFVLDGELLEERIHELGLPNSFPEVAMFVKTAFAKRLPRARLHETVDDLHYYVTTLVDDQVLNDDVVSGEIASTNGDGIDEIYIPIDDIDLKALPPPGQSFEQELEGHITMNIDTERPYSGHKIVVRATLAFERTGKVSISEPECEVVAADLDRNWSDDDDYEIPKVSLAQALADETGLLVQEAEELVDAEVIANESNDGMVYGYIFDFTNYASSTTAAKLEAKYGSLQLEVAPWFFERVLGED